MDPSFFFTSDTGAAQGEDDGVIIPCVSNLSISAFSSSRKCRVVDKRQVERMQWLSDLLPPGEEIAQRVPNRLGYAEDELNGCYGGLECCVRRSQLGMDVLPQGRLQQCVQQCDTLAGWGMFEIGLGHG